MALGISHEKLQICIPIQNPHYFQMDVSTVVRKCVVMFVADTDLLLNLNHITNRNNEICILFHLNLRIKQKIERHVLISYIARGVFFRGGEELKNKRRSFMVLESLLVSQLVNNAYFKAIPNFTNNGP